MDARVSLMVPQPYVERGTGAEWLLKFRRVSSRPQTKFELTSPSLSQPFRPRGSENIVPSVHHRHKSTGNLTSAPAATTAGFRGPAKRAAFGDVTNLTKNTASIRDEAKVSKGPSVVLAPRHAQPVGVVNKENIPYNSKDALSRPAQRNAALASKPKPSTEARPPEPAKRLVTSAAALEIGDYPEQGALVVPQQRSSAEVDKAIDPLISQSLHDGLPLQPRHHKSQPQLKPQQPTLRRTQSKQLERIDVAAVDRAANGSIDEAGLLPRLNDRPSAYPALPYGAGNYDPLPEPNHNEAYADLHVRLPEISEEPYHSAVSYREGQTPGLSEPEEWDEEDDEDYDDQDQAYTTAHSFRSRDLTTGGVTTLLAPRVTSRVQRELEEARMEVQRTRLAEDIEDEMWDISMVAEYGEEIFEYFRELEVKLLPNPHYMEIQTEIQWSMRSVLMDWLVQVHNRFSLLPETLYLTVNYIDRFLSCKVVSIGKLQLVGATAILVASKYEEINCPSLEEIVYMVDGGYSVEEILKAERFMLSMLSFELGWPGPMSFLRRVSKADDYDLDTRTLAKYFLELTIMDERFVASPPSFLAAGAHCLSRLILNKGDWTLQHVHYSGYTWMQVKPLVAMMIECCETPRLHHSAVYEKYKDRRFKEASTVVQRALDAGFKLPHHGVPIRASRVRPVNVEQHADRAPYTGGFLVPTEG
ncbi:G2/mitotic-specific cyclin cdc13 [Purpureocillium lavendulum]|uniref:G2/mitotic-specific cyclin cdc13 n=1 Tax=Purpureocillium lavendulum TaxID=1247861 RepID=A0AB34FJL9_9HYPO|nr:G2/mitotic-specific cyclin cdc13 [Purpureocillium lavendulum]